MRRKRIKGSAGLCTRGRRPGNQRVKVGSRYETPAFGSILVGLLHYLVLSTAVLTRPRKANFKVYFSTMDNPNNLASPRKRLKVQHLVENRNMDGAPDSPTKSMAEAGPAQDESATHLDKEAECGITEFVDRGKPGFSAILKKR